MRFTTSKRSRGCYGIGFGLNRVTSYNYWHGSHDLWAIELVLGRWIIYIDWDRPVKHK